ncbi:5333_t:CDS:2 [Entrophospora sp. SA101]|nr:5333_t:CDS:2 [Entrophospora sp. SA101]
MRFWVQLKSKNKSILKKQIWQNSNFHQSIYPTTTKKSTFEISSIITEDGFKPIPEENIDESFRNEFKLLKPSVEDVRKRLLDGEEVLLYDSITKESGFWWKLNFWGWHVVAFFIIIGLILLDTWQYFMHRYFHQNTFLYRHIHSLHHKLYAPYAFGALYNHPIEGFIMDTVGAGLSFKISGLSTRGGMLFFGFATLKTVDDHCGYALPFNPIQKIFGNNSA